MLKAYVDLQWLNVKVGILFAKLGIPPNTWTVMSLVPALMGFMALYYHNLGWALVLFVVSGFMDIIDGAVARVTKCVSNLGAFLDGIIDRYVEIIMYLGIWYFLQDTQALLIPTAIWTMLLIFGALMPSFVRAYADHREVVTDRDDQRRMGGLIERFERLTIIYFGMFFSLVYEERILLWALAVTAVLSNLTAIQRTLFVVSYSKKK
ncbi:MAG: CDP-alcohol phosphatidyltransferase family protein [Candidatus Altiarchaeota archaeon]